MKCALTAFFIVFIFQVQAQYLPVNSNFYMNPYVYNTAFAGSEGLSSVFLSYRKQWLGIDGAPAVSNFTFHAPLKRNVLTGASLTNETNGLLNFNMAHLTLGYRVYLAEGHYISFAASPAYVLNNIDYDGIHNTADPAIQKLMGVRSQFQLGLGFNYTYRKVNFGAFLPEMLPNTLLLTQVSDQKAGGMRAFQSYLFNASYDLNLVTGVLDFSPNLIYGKYTHFPEFVEGMGVFKLNDLLYFGASYRHGYGFTGLTGIKFDEGISFGYAMEMATAQRSSQFYSGTHEFQLKIRIGGNKLVSDVKRGRKMDEERRARLHLESEEEKLKNENVMHPGYYLVLNSFYFYDDADKYGKELIKRKKGLSPAIGYNERDNKFYVYVFASVSEKNVKKARRKFIRKRQIRSGKIITIK